MWNRTAAKLTGLHSNGYPFLVSYFVDDDSDLAHLPAVDALIGLMGVELIEVRIIQMEIRVITSGFDFRGRVQWPR